MAGLAIAWSAERLPVRVRPIITPTPALLATGALLAVLPDLDLLYEPLHRAASHSVTAVALTIILAAGVTWWVTGRARWGMAVVCGAAYASHLLLDWLGEDFNTPRGIQLLWPASDAWFHSGWDLFRGTERARPLSLPSLLHNLRTAVQEMATLGVLLLVLWITRRRPASSSQGVR